MLYYLIFGQEVSSIDAKLSTLTIIWNFLSLPRKVSRNSCGSSSLFKKHSIPQFDQKLKNGEAAHYSMREIAVETQKAGQRPPALYGVVILNKLCISALIL